MQPRVVRDLRNAESTLAALLSHGAGGHRKSVRGEGDSILAWCLGCALALLDLADGRREAHRGLSIAALPGWECCHHGAYPGLSQEK